MAKEKKNEIDESTINAETSETSETHSDDIPDTATENNIADSLIEDMPDVSEHAIEKHEAEQIESESIMEQAQASGLVDFKGRSFDPTIHETANGQPVTTPGGKLKCIRGRKKGGTNNNGSTVSQVGAGKQGKQESGQHDAHAAGAVSGKAAANLLMTIGVALGGDEWQPRIDHATGLNDQVMLEKAFSDYFIATGRTDLPSGWALTVAVGAYAAPRFAMPKTQTRAKTFAAKIGLWFKARKLKKQEKTNNAQSNSGNDRKRENDTSEKIEPTL